MAGKFEVYQDRAGKYRNALRGTRVANFSFVGTEDWEDFYPSCSGRCF